MESLVSFSAWTLAFIWVIGIPHFGWLLASKVSGFRLSQFTIGMGPRIAEFRIGATRYVLRVWPLCGESDFEWDESPSRVQYLLSAIGGPALTLFTALALIYSVGLTGTSNSFHPGAEFRATDPSNVTKLRSGDVILRANDQPVTDGLDLVRLVAGWQSGPLRLDVDRAGKLITVDLERSAHRKTKIIVRSSSSDHKNSSLNAILETPAYLADFLKSRYLGKLFRSAGIDQYILPQTVYYSDVYPGRMYCVYIAGFAFIYSILSCWRLPSALRYCITGYVPPTGSNLLDLATAFSAGVLLAIFSTWSAITSFGYAQIPLPTEALGFFRSYVANTYWSISF